MKRVVFSSLLFLFLFSFAFALEEPSIGVGGEDAEEIQKAIDDYIPIDDSGEIDYDRYKAH